MMPFNREVIIRWNNFRIEIFRDQMGISRTYLKEDISLPSLGRLSRIVNQCDQISATIQGRDTIYVAPPQRNSSY